MSSESQENVTSVSKYRDKMNVLLFGQSGAGKSTMIKSCVKNPDKIETGTGRPITLKTKAYQMIDTNIMLWDTRGLEVQNWQKTKELTFDYLQETWKKKDPEAQIHLIWYVINSGQTSVAGDIKVIEELRGQRVPVIVVLSKSKTKDVTKAPCYNTALAALADANVPIIPMLTEDLPLTIPGIGEVTVPKFGWNDLLNETMRVFPDAFKIASAKAARNWKSTARTLAISSLLGGVTISALIEIVPHLLKKELNDANWALELGKGTVYQGAQYAMFLGIARSYQVPFDRETLKQLIELFTSDIQNIDNAMSLMTMFGQYILDTAHAKDSKETKKSDTEEPKMTESQDGSDDESTEEAHKPVKPGFVFSLKKLSMDVIVAAIVRAGVSGFIGAMFIYCLDSLLVESTDVDKANDDSFCWPAHDLSSSITSMYNRIRTNIVG